MQNKTKKVLNNMDTDEMPGKNAVRNPAMKQSYQLSLHGWVPGATAI